MNVSIFFLIFNFVFKEEKKERLGIFI